MLRVQVGQVAQGPDGKPWVMLRVSDPYIDETILLPGDVAQAIGPEIAEVGRMSAAGIIVAAPKNGQG